MYLMPYMESLRMSNGRLQVIIQFPAATPGPGDGGGVPLRVAGHQLAVLAREDHATVIHQELPERS